MKMVQLLKCSCEKIHIASLVVVFVTTVKLTVVSLLLSHSTPKKKYFVLFGHSKESSSLLIAQYCLEYGHS